MWTRAKFTHLCRVNRGAEGAVAGVCEWARSCRVQSMDSEVNIVRVNTVTQVIMTSGAARGISECGIFWQRSRWARAVRGMGAGSRPAWESDGS